MINTKNDVILKQWQDYNLARSLIQNELTGIFGSETLRDMNEILALYNIYENGANFETENNGDYVPAQHKFKIIRGLINKEARFLFSVPPTISLKDLSPEPDKNRLQPNEQLIDTVLSKNNFYSKLVRAAKDCLIGKRIAIVVNFGIKTIDVSFVPSLEFIYETDPTDVDTITKFIQFYSTVVNDDKNQQRIYKKKWELNDDGYCVVTEELYDGNAKLVETILPEQVTKLKYIPAFVIINDGLTGDPFGKSDVESLIEDESWYSRLGSKDFDSLRKGADQIVYAMDINPRSTKNLSRSAGSFWDLNSDPAAREGVSGKVGVLENSMAYSPALESSLNRLRAYMYSQLSVPDTTSEALTGVISSGKTMKALYWDLIISCGEKMLDWIPALKHVVKTIIDGSMLYPELRKLYVDEEPVEDYAIEIENSYPILEDETEEKATDILEVNAKVMSKKAYMQKWRSLNSDEADKELEQIKFEQSLFEQDSVYFPNELPEEDE